MGVDLTQFSLEEFLIRTVKRAVLVVGEYRLDHALRSVETLLLADPLA